MRAITKRVRESKVERDGTDFAESRGWMVFKFVSPGRKAVPDRLYLRSKDGASRTVFIEWKAPGEKPTPAQMKMGRDLIKAGAEWYWTDSLEKVKDVLY